MGRRRALTRGVILAALGLLALALLLGGEFGLGGSESSTTTTPTATAAAADGSVSAEEADAIGAVLAAIDVGEQLPYEQDGGVFQNREGLLPDEPQGYYREYTVATPGSDDRGARRLVIGSEHETYYTADHYGSFVLIDPEDFR